MPCSFASLQDFEWAYASYPGFSLVLAKQFYVLTSTCGFLIFNLQPETTCWMVISSMSPGLEENKGWKCKTEAYSSLILSSLNGEHLNNKVLFFCGFMFCSVTQTHFNESLFFKFYLGSDGVHLPCLSAHMRIQSHTHTHALRQHNYKYPHPHTRTQLGTQEHNYVICLSLLVNKHGAS